MMGKHSLACAAYAATQAETGPSGHMPWAVSLTRSNAATPPIQTPPLRSPRMAALEPQWPNSASTYHHPV